MTTQATYEYDRQDAQGATCTASAWAKVLPVPGPDERARLKARAKELLKARDAALVAHYYVDGDLQDLALETGGCVADSLEMARFGRDAPQRTLVVAGVRFMGETSKILSPAKRVLMPDLDATCSLDLGCPAEDFAAFCDSREMACHDWGSPPTAMSRARTSSLRLVSWVDRVVMVSGHLDCCWVLQVCNSSAADSPTRLGSLPTSFMATNSAQR